MSSTLFALALSFPFTPDAPPLLVPRVEIHSVHPTAYSCRLAATLAHDAHLGLVAATCYALPECPTPSSTSCYYIARSRDTNGIGISFIDLKGETHYFPAQSRASDVNASDTLASEFTDGPADGGSRHAVSSTDGTSPSPRPSPSPAPSPSPMRSHVSPLGPTVDQQARKSEGEGEGPFSPALLLHRSPRHPSLATTFE